MTIAILAHDSRKELALQFCTAYSAILSKNTVIATGTTGRMLAQTTGLPVHCYLSGGEQQLVLIARALAQKAEVLMMDEPTSALDYGNQLRILQMVRRLAAQGYTVILSTHNPQHALTFATTLLALHGGTAAAWGRPAQVLTPELMETLYGVRAEFLQTASGPVLAPCVEDW